MLLAGVSMLVFLFSFVGFSSWYIFEDASLVCFCLYVALLGALFHRLPYTSISPGNGFIKLEVIATRAILLSLASSSICFISSGVPLQVMFSGALDYKDIEFPPMLAVVSQASALVATCLASARLVYRRSTRSLFIVSAGIIIILCFVGRGIFSVWFLFTALFFFSVKFESARINWRKFYKTLGAVILFGALFGSLGELRSNNNVNFNRAESLDVSIIRHLARPTSAFDATGIPDQFLWIYIYIVSPLGNLQELGNKPHTGKVQDALLATFVPELILKRTVGLEEKDKSHLVTDFFNTSTGYAPIFTAAGTVGLYFVATSLWALLYCLMIIQKRSVFRDIFACFYSVLFAVMWFENIFVKDVYFLPLLIFLLVSMAHGMRSRTVTLKVV